MLHRASCFLEVPVLDVGDFSLPQSKAIERYVVTWTDFDKEIAEKVVKLQTFFGFFLNPHIFLGSFFSNLTTFPHNFSKWVEEKPPTRD